MLKKNLKKVIIFTLLITILISSTCLAATPKLINNLEKNLNTIKEWIIKISTPAAAFQYKKAHPNKSLSHQK